MPSSSNSYDELHELREFLREREAAEKEAANEIRKLRESWWRSLAGNLVDFMLASKETTATYLHSEDANVRTAAINILLYHWQPTPDTAQNCERLALKDPDDDVRAIAIVGMGRCFSNTHNARIRRLLANWVTDDAVKTDLRVAAYWALLFVCGVSPLSTPFPEDLVFPDDIDWALVRRSLTADEGIPEPAGMSDDPAIVQAAQDGHADVVEFLISMGAEIEPRKVGRSLLHEAAKHGHQNVIDVLLDRGLKLDLRDMQGATLLHAAAGGAQPEIVRFLLSKGADARAVDFSKGTPLHAVARWRPFVKKRDKCDPKIIERVLVVARLLIEAGADPNARDEHSCTPLHEAARNGYVEVAELLISNGADVNARNHRNETPLSWCESHAHPGYSNHPPPSVADLLHRLGGVQ